MFSHGGKCLCSSSCSRLVHLATCPFLSYGLVTLSLCILIGGLISWRLLACQLWHWLKARNYDHLDWCIKLLFPRSLKLFPLFWGCCLSASLSSWAKVLWLTLEILVYPHSTEPWTVTTQQHQSFPLLSLPAQCYRTVLLVMIICQSLMI